MAEPLIDIIELLQRWAPLEWAEAWDNVGLLVEADQSLVQNILLTIDLTEEVLDEAKALGCDLIIAYHPVIFSGMKRLTNRTPVERIVRRCLQGNIAVYCPHTALDAAPLGMNEWLAHAFGDGAVTPITHLPGSPEGFGMGRIIELARPAVLSDLIPGVKRHLGLEHVRVATAARHQAGEPIRRAAACAGAGGSVFEQCHDVDLLLTGEMRHHDILARLAAGTSVIVTDHTNTERGYLPVLAERLQKRFGARLRLHLAETDHDPLRVS